MRVLFLLVVLLVVSVTTCQDRYRSTRWREPLYVAIYPIAADESPRPALTWRRSMPERFKPIDRFFAREALRYHLRTDEPIRTRLRPELKEHPPHARNRRRDIRDGACGACKLRYWAWRVSGHVA